jgi:FF domain
VGSLSFECARCARHSACTADAAAAGELQEDAKLAFKQLLASVGMRSDWSWEQAMRLIVSDGRCVAATLHRRFCCCTGLEARRARMGGCEAVLMQETKYPRRRCAHKCSQQHHSPLHLEILQPTLLSPCRYGALKSLGEKKACFHEYAQQRKNEEKDEARQK